VDFGKVLEALADFFKKENCRYAIAGAFALHAYGLSRATGDLDFVVSSECRVKIVAFLESLGYETIYVSSGYSNHVHPLPAMGRVDFIYPRGATADMIFNNLKASLKYQVVTIPVPRPEHIAAMKIFSMKNDPSRTFQEMADIQFLLGLPGINQEEVRGYFEKYGLLTKYYEIKEKGLPY